MAGPPVHVNTEGKKEEGSFGLRFQHPYQRG